MAVVAGGGEHVNNDGKLSLTAIRENREFIGAGALILLSVVALVFFGYIATTRNLTSLEAYCFQVFALVAGLIGSYLSGRLTARSIGRELFKPHARSAFRRVRALSTSMVRVRQVISNPHLSSETKLAVIAAVAEEQIVAANDALEDWKDVVPDLVNRPKAPEEQRGN